MEKMTNVKALEIVLAMELADEVREKIEKMKASYEKKSASRSDKPTKTQEENMGIKSAILDAMEVGKAYTISEMMKEFPCLEGFSNQKISALVRQLKEEHLLDREEIKRKAYFTKVVA